MANDDLSGCAAAIELFKWLEGQNTRYSYRLLILQEIVASEFYLQSLGAHGKELVLGALFLEMLGSETQLALQHSMNADSAMEQRLHETLTELGIDHRSGDFKSVIGNDEIVWEAHGIPMPSLSRFPFHEYHTSDDDLNIISKNSLRETQVVLRRLVEKLEQTRFIKKNFNGLPAVSNPKFDIYVDTWGQSTGEMVALRTVMDYLPTLGTYSQLDRLFSRFDVSEESLMTYLRKWEGSGLVDII